MKINIELDSTLNEIELVIKTPDLNNDVALIKDLVEKGQILEALKEIKDRETLQRFCRYMEALVAYFKFYGGKD